MILIIGGGPVGCYTGYLLAKAGKKVAILEEDRIIGKPFSCTGIVTEELFKILPEAKTTIINKLTKARIYSKNSSLEIPIADYTIDRVMFDQTLAKLAQKAGAKILTSHKVNNITGQDKIYTVKTKNNKQFKADILIGADGPDSIVAKAFKMSDKKQYIIGSQVRCRGKFDKDCFEVDLNIRDFFGWIVPESEKIARIGIGAKKNPSLIMSGYLDKINYKTEIIDRQAGLIPIYNKNIRSQKDKVYLVGDSAGQIKSTTGGGLVPGLKCAKILALSIIKNLDYDKKWKKEVGRGLILHNHIRKSLLKLSDKDLDNILRMLNDKKLKPIFQRISRDSPIKLVFNLIVQKPALIWYGFKVHLPP